MKPGVRVLLLRIMATAAVNAFIYAGTVTLRAAVFGTDGGAGSILLFISTVILAHAAGAFFMGSIPAFASKAAGTKAAGFLSFMLNIKDGAHLTSSAAGWSLILLPALVSFFSFVKYGILRALFEILPVFVAYIVSVKHSNLSPSRIIGKNAVYSSLFVLVVCLELPYFIGRIHYLRSWMFGIAYFFIFSYLIVKNQEDIDVNIYEKKHIEKSILPKNLRKFNLKTVCVVFFVILLMFNLKTVVIALLDLLGKFVILIVKVILAIIDKIIPEQEMQPDGGMPSGEPALPDLAAGPPSPFGNLIFNIMKNFSILYIAYRLVLLIVKKLPVISGKIAELFKRLFSVKNDGFAAEESDYTDETETIRPARSSAGGKEAVRKLKKGGSELKKVKDPALRVRLMYSIIMSTLPRLGVKPEKSDTPMEVAAKTMASGEIYRELSPFAGIYSQVRYREEKPDAEILSDAEEHFRKTVEVIRRSK